LPATVVEGAVSRAPAKLPWPIRPMLAKASVALPRDADHYGYELKWDGFRTLLFLEAGKARVQSRNLRDVTREYPEMQAVAQALRGRQLVLDGELVVLDAKGRPSFEGMQRRAGYLDPLPRAQREPVVFFAFDLLWSDGESLMAQPYTRRRDALDELGLKHASAWVPPSQDDGAAMQDAARAMKLEGVVAKGLDSPYEAGKRTGAWLKVRDVQRQELVIGGYTLGEGNRKGKLGALLVGHHEPGADALRFAGGVGTGFTEKVLAELRGKLDPLIRSESPFQPHEDIPSGAVFVEPRLVCEVKFATWTPGGILRHASFLGLREDKDPDDVEREVT